VTLSAFFSCSDAAISIPPDAFYTLYRYIFLKKESVPESTARFVRIYATS